MYAVSSITESIFFLLCGHVPQRRHPIWNLTRASLKLSCTTVTQDVSATSNILGYVPSRTTSQSFEYMVDEYMREHGFSAKKKSEKESSSSKNNNTLARVSWSAPAGVSFDNVNFFDRMSGPGITTSEAAITTLGMVGGMCYAYWQSREEWSTFQLVVSLSFALINASAVAQCTTPTSKRWYHMGGKLSNHLAFVIAAEVAVLVFILHATFGDGGRGGVHAAFGKNTVMEAVGVASAVLLTHFSPLPIQRAVGVICMCGGFGLLQANNSLCTAESNCPGMEWAIPLLLVKYCVSHVPRHEPYV